MKELLIIAISSALVSNVVLSQFLGICSFVGVSKKVETAAGMGGAVIFVITIASIVANLIYQFVLAPLGIDYLKTIVFILVIAALVQIDQKWKASGMKSKSAFIRHLILYGYVYDVNYEHLREYNTTLARIGNNLNQIAKRMNATGNVYKADVNEVKELMKQVWQSQKSMLSRQPSIRQ